MTSRRAFFAGLAAIAAPLFARLALPRAPERKRLPMPLKTGTMNELLSLRIPHAGVHTEQVAGHLYVQHHDISGKAHWSDLGEVRSMRLGG